MASQSLGDPLLQRRGLLDEPIAQSMKELGKFLQRPIQHVLRKQSSSRTELYNGDLRRRSQGAPHLVELPGQQPSEHSVHIARGEEIAPFPELFGVAGIVAELWVVKAQLHVAGKGNRSVIVNFLLDDLSQLAHSPFFCRSNRSWGVRMNISTK